LAWQIRLTATAEKELAKLDKQAAQRIIRFLKDRISVSENPRTLGKQLTGELASFWRFRVGDYRIICDIQENELTVLTLRIAHRKEAYSF
jgi:mRNA interferase RelE/StbE